MYIQHRLSINLQKLKPQIIQYKLEQLFFQSLITYKLLYPEHPITLTKGSRISTCELIEGYEQHKGSEAKDKKARHEERSHNTISSRLHRHIAKGDRTMGKKGGRRRHGRRGGGR